MKKMFLILFVFIMGCSSFIGGSSQKPSSLDHSNLVPKKDNKDILVLRGSSEKESTQIKVNWNKLIAYYLIAFFILSVGYVIYKKMSAPTEIENPFSDKKE